MNKEKIDSNKIKQIVKILFVVSAISLITPSVAFGSGADSSASTTQSVAATIDEQTLSHTVNQVLSAQVPSGSFTVASSGSKILLAGQVPTKADRAKAEAGVANIVGVSKVWNYLTVGPNEDSQAIAKDAYLTSATKTRLMAQKGVNTNNIKVVTSNQVVYLLGNNAGNHHQLKAAIAGVKQIDNVKNVVNLIGQ